MQHCPLPAGVHGGHYAGHGVIEQHGHAVGGAHAYRNAAQRCHEGVVAFEVLPRRVGPVYHGHTAVVDLMALNHGVWERSVPTKRASLGSTPQIVSQKVIFHLLFP